MQIYLLYQINDGIDNAKRHNFLKKNIIIHNPIFRHMGPSLRPNYCEPLFSKAGPMNGKPFDSPLDGLGMIASGPLNVALIIGFFAFKHH